MRNNALRRNHASLSLSGLKNLSTSKYDVMSSKNDNARPESRKFPPENVGSLMWLEGLPDAEPMSLSAETPDALKYHSLLASKSPDSFLFRCEFVLHNNGGGGPDRVTAVEYSCLSFTGAMLDPVKEDGRARVDNSRVFLKFSDFVFP